MLFIKKIWVYRQFQISLIFFLKSPHRTPRRYNAGKKFFNNNQMSIKTWCMNSLIISLWHIIDIFAENVFFSDNWRFLIFMWNVEKPTPITSWSITLNLLLREKNIHHIGYFSCKFNKNILLSLFKICNFFQKFPKYHTWFF